MKKRLIYILFLMSLLSLTFSCQNESYDFIREDGSIEVLEDGRLRVPILLQIPEQEVVETKSAPDGTETAIKNAYVLVFDQDQDNLLRQCVTATLDQSDRTKIYAKLSPSPTSCFIHILINLSAENIAIINAATKLDDIRHLTEMQSSLDTGILPLSSARIGLSAININTVKDLNIPLKFAYARIDIIVNKGINDQFSLQEAFVINAAKKGYVIEHASLSPDLDGEARSKTINAANNLINGLYIFENSGALTNQQQGTNPTDLLIKGTKTGFDEGYYKIRIAYGTDKATYDIRRGVRYAVNLTSVKGPGYTTPEEAIANEPANIEYDITVNDESSKDVVISNGQYYLGVSNSEYIIYADDAYGVTATTLSHNAPHDKVNKATVEVQGTGITLSANQQGLTVSSDGKSATINLQTPQMPIKVDLTSTVTQPCTLTIRIGDLVKMISIKKKPMVEDAGKTITLSDLGLANSSIATMKPLSPRITVDQNKSLIIARAIDSKYDPFSYAEAFSTGHKGTIRIAVKQTIQNVVYYEQYVDESYGFYFRDKTSTLSEDKIIKDTGYGILGTRRDIDKIQLENHLTGQIFIPELRIISELSDYPMNFYPMSHKNINPIKHTNAVSMLINGAQTSTNYIYPNFAKLITTSSAIDTNTPFFIRTPKQFRNINAIASLDGNTRTYRQERDLNFADTNIGGAATFSSAIISNEFRGTYDGRGKQIANITLNDRTGSMALFRENTGVLFNMRLYNINVTGGSNTSCLVGINYGEIRQVLIDGLKITSNGQGIGPIAGINSLNGLIDNCLVMATGENSSLIYSSHTNPFIGGIAGLNDYNSRGIKNVCVLDKRKALNTPFVNSIKASNTTAGIVGHNQSLLKNAIYLAMPPYASFNQINCQFPICRYYGVSANNTQNNYYLRLFSYYLRGEKTGIGRKTYNRYYDPGNQTNYYSFDELSVEYLGLDPVFWERVPNYPYPKLKSFPTPLTWPVAD